MNQPTSTSDEALIELLIFWWRYERQWTPVKSYPRICPSTQGFRVDQSQDSDNGAADTDARGREAERIGAIINAIEEPYRTALSELARAKATRRTMRQSPRLPINAMERGVVVSRALDLFSMMV